MACTITLHQFLTGSPDQGGTWTLQSGGPMLASVNGNPAQTFSNGNTISTQWNATLGFDDTVAGTYVVRYTVGTAPCADTSDLTITVVNGALAGVDVTLTRCTTDTTVYNLFDFLRGGNGTGTGTGTVDTTGTWSGSGTGPAFTTAPNDAYKPVTGAPTDDTFQPSLVNMGGNPTTTAVFIYTVNKGGPAGCTNCQDTATITFITTQAGNAGGDGAVTVCNDPT